MAKCLNPDCDYRVPWRAKYCPKCGTGAPGGVVTCGSCGKEVYMKSKFCGHCGQDLSVGAEPRFTSNRWARDPKDFAIRVDPVDIKGWLVKPLIIEHGTRALLFQHGTFAGELGPGRYDVDGFLARFTNFMIDKASSVVLMDGGDVTIDMENGDLDHHDPENRALWTADPFEVGLSSRLVFRLVNPEALFVNLMKERGRVTLAEVERGFDDEVHMLLSGIVAKYRAEQLFSNLEIRDEIETQLRNHLARTCERLGLALVQLRFVEFRGEAFEKLREAEGEIAVEEKEVDLTERRKRLAQRLREILTQDKMDEIKTEKDLEDFITQMDHELGLKGIIRDDEMKALEARLRFGRKRDRLLRFIELIGIRNDAMRLEKWEQLLTDERQEDEKTRRELNRKLETAKSDADISEIKLAVRGLEFDEDKRQAEWGQLMLEKTKEIEYQEKRRDVELEGQTLEQRSKATAEALISIVDGPAAQQIKELEELRRKQNLSPEQMLALASETSQDAAQTLAEHYKAKGKLNEEVKAQLEERIKELHKVYGDSADRVQWLTQVALEQMGGVAATRARPADPPAPTIVTPGGGGGSPVIVNVACCRFCDSRLEKDGGFCPACGKKQK